MIDHQAPRIEACNCFAARRTARQISRFYDATLSPTGLRITQFLTLAVLSDNPGASMLALAERLDVEQTAMGKMAATLERDGLVRIQRSPTDGRSRVVDLTPQGRALFETAIPLWQSAQRQFEARNGAGAVQAVHAGFSIPEMQD